MKWNDRLKALRDGASRPEEQTMPGIATVINCQNSILSVNVSSQLGRGSKIGCKYTPADLEMILEERIAILIFDGGLSEAEAVRVAGDEVRRGSN